MFHDFLLIFVLRIRQLVVLELSSSQPILEYFVFEYLGEVLSFIDNPSCARDCSLRGSIFHDVRPVIPIVERKLVAEAH